MFQLPEGPEFVFQEERETKRRNWSENLQFYTGCGYLGGGSVLGVFTNSVQTATYSLHEQ